MCVCIVLCAGELVVESGDRRASIQTVSFLHAHTHPDTCIHSVTHVHTCTSEHTPAGRHSHLRSLCSRPPIPKLTGILAEELDEGIQVDAHRPTSVLSNNSGDSQQPAQRASTFSGTDATQLAVLRKTSVSSSISSLRSSESTRRHSTATASSDSCGTVVDTTARQPIAEPAPPTGSHTPNASSMPPQSCPTLHRRNISIGSRCSSAYSTMSDTDRRILQQCMCVYVCMCACACACVWCTRSLGPLKDICASEIEIVSCRGVLCLPLTDPRLLPGGPPSHAERVHRPAQGEWAGVVPEACL